MNQESNAKEYQDFVESVARLCDDGPVDLGEWCSSTLWTHWYASVRALAWEMRTDGRIAHAQTLESACERSEELAKKGDFDKARAFLAPHVGQWNLRRSSAPVVGF
jgi:hypothetical protein